MPIKKKPTRNTAKSPPPPSTRQAVIYARVSSKEQEDEGFSIPSQLKLLHDYARKMGLVVTQDFVEAETAKKTGRSQYNEMLRHLEKSAPTGKRRVLLVEKTDRLYRNLKDYVILEELDIEVHLVKEGVCCRRIPVRRIGSCTASRC